VAVLGAIITFTSDTCSPKAEVDTIGKKEEAPRIEQRGSGNLSLTISNAGNGLSVVMLAGALWAIRRRERALKATVCGVEHYRKFPIPGNIALSIQAMAVNEKIEPFLHKKVKRWTA
jgi:hypothetical protein